MGILISIILIGVGVYLYLNYQKAKKNIFIANTVKSITQTKGVPSAFFTHSVNTNMEHIKSLALLDQKLHPQKSWAECLADSIEINYTAELFNQKLKTVVEVLNWYKLYNLQYYSDIYHHTNLENYLRKNKDTVEEIYNIEVFDVGCISNFSGMTTPTITEIPIFIKKLPNLKAIIMGSATSPEIYSVALGELDLNLLVECANLQVACFQYCNIRSIKFHGDRKISKLRHLKLGANELKEIPDTLCKLNTLEVLTLWQNELTELPLKIGELTNLKGLDIMSTKIYYLPKSIINLNLKTFYYDDNIQFSYPEKIWLKNNNL